MKENFLLLRETVVEAGLCTRCGTCIGICPTNVLSVDVLYYPEMTGKCVSCGLCYRSCPGADVDLPALTRAVFSHAFELDNLQGYVENTYVSHPVNPEIREAGASSGLVTALLVYLLEKKKINGALIVGPDPARPWQMQGLLARTAEAICHGSQSKYCVTSSLSLLQEIRHSKGKFAVVGLPCQVQALRKLALVDPRLANKIEYIFGLYCSCTMEPNGHLEAMRTAGIRPEEIERFDFRGGGWPGSMMVRKKDQSKIRIHCSQTYATVINVMFRLFGSKRCNLCVDGLAELADLSFGDFWAFDYPDEFGSLERCTLVSQRSQKGLDLLVAAEQDGLIVNRILPGDRISKRTLSMVRGKRARARVFFAERKKKNLAVPDYHVEIPEPGKKEKRKTLTFHLFNLFRGSLCRRCILFILFSPLTLFIHKLNRVRINLFADYGDN